MAILYNIRSIYMVALIETADIRVDRSKRVLKRRNTGCEGESKATVRSNHNVQPG